MAAIPPPLRLRPRAPLPAGATGLHSPSAAAAASPPPAAAAASSPLPGLPNVGGTDVDATSGQVKSLADLGEYEQCLVAQGSLEQAFCCAGSSFTSASTTQIQGDIFLRRIPLKNPIFSVTLQESIELRRQLVEGSSPRAANPPPPPLVMSPTKELKMTVRDAQECYESDRNFSLSLDAFLELEQVEEEKERITDEREREAEHDANPDQENGKLVVDRYGFVLASPEQIANNAKAMAKEAVSAEKWLEIVSQWGVLERKKKLRTKIRKGVPDRVRGMVWKKMALWKKMAKLEELRADNPGLFASLVAQPSPFEAQINRDISRTFPTHVMFRESGGMGQTLLFNVLKAYSVYDKEVGYCQGMAFIVALFLLYMPEEDAFLMLIRVCQHYELNGFFLPGFPLLHKYFHLHEQSMCLVVPGLTSHLQSEMVGASMYAFQWYSTVFTAEVLPFEYVLRIWDMFLLDGNKFLLRVSLALLKLHQDELTGLSFENLVPRLKSFQSINCTPDDLIKTALELHLSTRKVEKIEKEYDASTQIVK
eukprot:CAMPEP_0177681136 /NCGR_PEP_ID=MMETSP0447-20121125/30549_1 /TAXON_ID=0 /ORGANISM="Stygamoeba regulata, Strain BSH-02190019" /LENGTH=535 /DNA_ID=CAMNT_0019190521 /DNA_START=163 /DNA_END=1770 /DNA_ORIENTATION=-